MKRMVYAQALAIACLLLLFLGVQYEIAFDGAATTYYGFPLPWNGGPVAVSMSKDVFVVPLLVDAVVLGAAGLFASRWLYVRLMHWPRWLRATMTWTVCVAGVLAVWFMYLVIYIDPDYKAWYDPAASVSGMSIGMAI